MNLQDVSNLQIPDGDVRTIHDKNRRLLWGAVGYDVSFNGDAENESPLFQTVAYIESTGTQYIKTGLASTSGQVWSATLDMEFTEAASGNTVMLSPATTSWVGQSGGFYAIGGENYRSPVSATTRQTVQVSFGSTLTMTVGGETVSRTMNTDSGEFSLFAGGINGRYKSSAKLYSCKIYDSTNTLVRDFRPCVRTSDNAIGLYDVVGKTFYTNAGTGVFSKGSNVAMPSPDFPLNVCTATGENVVKVLGKNIFTPTSPTRTTTRNGVTITIDDDGKVTLNGTATANLYPDLVYGIQQNTVAHSTCYQYFGANLQITASLMIAGGTATGLANDSVRFVFNDEGTAVPVRFDGASTSTTINNAYGLNRVWFNIPNGATFDNYSFYCQLELGSQATSYQAYTEQSFTIDLGSTELAKIGTYQDRIYKDGEKWYIEKNVGKLTITGNESAWSVATFTNNPNHTLFQTREYDTIIGGATTFDSMSDYFIQSPTVVYASMPAFDGAIVSIGSGGNYKMRFGVPNSVATDATTWTTWLQSHPTAVYYALATPTTAEITDSTLVSQLNAIYDWMRRYGYNALVLGDLPIIINRADIS